MNEAPDIADAPTPDARPAVATPPRLVGALRAFARRELTLALTGGVARVALLFLAAAFVRGLLDYWLQLSWFVRAAFLAADLAIAGWIVRNHLWRPWQRRLRDATAALRLQRAFPALGSHLIAAVQLPAQVADGRASPEIVASVVSDADERLARIDWREAAPARPAIRLAGPAIALLAAGIACCIYFSDTAPLILRRVWLSTEAPFTRTKLVVEPGDADVALGASVTLRARTSGVIPDEAVFEVRGEEGGTRAFNAAATGDTPGEFPLPIDNVQQSFRYRVLAGDARGDWHRISVLLPPVLADLAVTIEPPAYTGLPVTTATDDVLNVPAGSTLRLAGRATGPLKDAHVALWNSAGDEAPATLLPLSVDDAAFTGGVPADSLPAAISIRLHSDNGLFSQNDTRLRLRLIPDQRPVIVLTSAPADNALATATQSLSLAGQVADDYGVTGLRLCWQLTLPDSAEPLLESQELDLPVAPPRQARFDVTLPIDRRAVPGTTLTWWLEAGDQNLFNPGPAATPKQTIRIVTPEEKVAATLEQVREQSSAIDEISRAQDALSEALGRTIEKTQQP